MKCFKMAVVSSRIDYFWSTSAIFRVLYRVYVAASGSAYISLHDNMGIAKWVSFAPCSPGAVESSPSDTLSPRAGGKERERSRGKGAQWEKAP